MIGSRDRMEARYDHLSSPSSSGKVKGYNGDKEIAKLGDDQGVGERRERKETKKKGEEE